MQGLKFPLHSFFLACVFIYMCKLRKHTLNAQWKRLLLPHKLIFDSLILPSSVFTHLLPGESVFVPLRLN